MALDHRPARPPGTPDNSGGPGTAGSSRRGPAWLSATGRRRPNGLAVIAGVAALLYAGFILLPLGLSLASSLTDENPLKAESSFVGLDNYQHLFRDGRLLHSLAFTFALAAVVTLAANAVGLGLAVLLDRSSLPYRLMRTLAFLPQVLSGVIVGFIWRSVLTQNGLANALLMDAGIIREPIGWLGTPFMASLSIAIVMAWVLSGFTTVVYLAALQAVPRDLYEAATVDGAGAARRFRSITFPLLAPATTINVTICLITVLKLYDVITVVTGGGPASSTESTALYIVKVAFTQNQFGYSSAVAVLLLVVSTGVSLLVTSLLRRREVSL